MYFGRFNQVLMAQRELNGALFSGQLGKLDDFIENEEAKAIILWDSSSDIGQIEEIDKKLREYV